MALLYTITALGRNWLRNHPVDTKIGQLLTAMSLPRFELSFSADRIGALFATTSALAKANPQRVVLHCIISASIRGGWLDELVSRGLLESNKVANDAAVA